MSEYYDNYNKSTDYNSQQAAPQQNKSDNTVWKKKEFKPITSPWFAYGLILESDLPLNDETIRTLDAITQHADSLNMELRTQVTTTPWAFKTPRVVKAIIPFPKMDDLEKSVLSDPSKEIEVVYSGKWNKEMAKNLFPSQEKGIVFTATKITAMVGGFNTSPSTCVIINANGGCEHALAPEFNDAGYSKQTITLAGRLGIPVINLQNGDKAIERFRNIVSVIVPE